MKIRRYNIYLSGLFISNCQAEFIEAKQKKHFELVLPSTGSGRQMIFYVRYD